MALPWVRMDTQWPHNPKFLVLVEEKKWRAIAVYWGAVGWSGAQGLDGYFAAYALPMVHGRKTDAADLVSVGLWEPADGGWQIRSWADFQITGEEYEQRRERARIAAQKRWGNA